jgi:predicted DNA-binding protein
MPTKNPRVNVTFNPSDAECLKLICNKKNMSLSGLVRKVIEDWLEDYEDMLLARRAEKAEEEWIKDGCTTYTMEEVCQELGIQLNLEETPKIISKNSQKTSKKGSSGLSNKGSRSRRKTVNH